MNSATPAPEAGPAPLDMFFLSVLQGKPLYMGTVPEQEIAKRRAKNKVARRSRKLNRK